MGDVWTSMVVEVVGGGGGVWGEVVGMLGELTVIA
jgi:hypothetical protein